MATCIRLALSNFPLTFLILGLIVALLSLVLSKEPRTSDRIREKIFANFLLFALGISFFYNFVMHVFFGAMSARFIGWQNSPFQAEVGYRELRICIGCISRGARLSWAARRRRSRARILSAGSGGGSYPGDCGRPQLRSRKRRRHAVHGRADPGDGAGAALDGTSQNACVSAACVAISLQSADKRRRRSLLRFFPRPTCFNNGGDAAARTKLPTNCRPHRITGLHDILQHLVDDVFLEDSEVAVGEQIFLVRLQFEAFLARLISQENDAEIRQTGLWTD